jgi:putative solute:sodium symporter small subunit
MPAHPEKLRSPAGLHTPEASAAHWRRTRRLTLFVVIVWAIFALGIHCFATALNAMTFLGFPLGYYMAAQGSLIVFVLLVLFQNWRQDAIDDEFGYGD